jgi:ABC-type hemin transport system ATPase subunit
VKILEGVDVGMRGSEITAVVGSSGAGMVLFAAWTSARRAEKVPRAFLVAAVATLGVLLTLRIVPPRGGT